MCPQKYTLAAHKTLAGALGWLHVVGGMDGAGMPRADHWVLGLGDVLDGHEAARLPSPPPPVPLRAERDEEERGAGQGSRTCAVL